MATKTRSASSPAQTLYEKIGQEMASDSAGIKRSNAFGAPCLKVRGKIFACWWGEAMVFKLGGEVFAEAMALKGAQLFNPMGKGRGMKAVGAIAVRAARQMARVRASRA